MEFQLKTSNLSPKKVWKLESILRLTTKYSELCKNIENWMEKSPTSGTASIEEHMLQFQEETGIENLRDILPGLSVDSKDGLSLLMRSLSHYYLAGFLIESLQGHEKSSWWVTGFFFKGQWFDLDLSDQIRLIKPLPRMSPLQVKTSNAIRMLEEYKLNFLPIEPTTRSFLFRPTHVTSLMLLTESPEPFSRLKVEGSHSLINRFFNP